MLESFPRSQVSVTITDPERPDRTEGSSYTYEQPARLGGFLTAGSTAVTVDLGSQLVSIVSEWKSLPKQPLKVYISEMRDWESIIEKINALESVAGLLNELTSEEIEIFEAAVKRRRLFK